MVPEWAKGRALQTALLTQSAANPDPDEVFAGVPTERADVKEIFGAEPRNRGRRGPRPPSPAWQPISQPEIRTYRAQMSAFAQRSQQLLRQQMASGQPPQ